ncbi:Qat anti-phage system associated protein QatB [Promicromonospora sp. NPDC050880]|uniref:Qat anti-phage system associated protein QatB n=1 Tax=Promicromonospora sp. NPDC050880 TaxID=3364406 RepID=UPI0037A35D65
MTRGYGGSGTMSRRMGSTATTAGRLGGVLRTGVSPAGTDLRDAVLASGTDANGIMDVIVEAVRPSDGTQDAESSRAAMRDALSETLSRYPDANLLQLDSGQREFVIERFTALDVYSRFRLDLEKTLRAKAPDASTALRRLSQVREFIVEEVASAFREIRGRKNSPTIRDVTKLTDLALKETFIVFEEYLL